MGLFSPADDEQLRLTELQLWAVSMGVTVWIIDLEPYESCRVAGLVQQLRIDPSLSCIDASVFDGTGVITARWPIRPAMPELRAMPGRAVILEGVPVINDSAELVLVNPDFEMVRFPAVA